MDCPNCQEEITKLVEPTLELVQGNLLIQFGCPSCHAMIYDFDRQDEIDDYEVMKVADHASPGSSVAIIDFDKPADESGITHETWKEYAERYANEEY